MTDTTTADRPEVPGADDVEAFIDTVSMEEDPAELFPGDSGTLDADVRRVLVRLLQRRFLLADKNRAQWRTLLDNQQVIESRLHDLFVHLRSVYLRGQSAGEASVRVDVEEIEQTALTYFDPDDTNVAARQREIRTAVARLAKEGVVEEESEGRYRVTPLVEVVLSNERLSELSAWLREQVRTGGGATADEAAADEAPVEDEAPVDEAPDA